MADWPHCPGCKGFTPDWSEECAGIPELPADLVTDAAMHTCGDPMCYQPGHLIPLGDVLTSYARCNFDGRPLSPGDQAVVDRFARWLAMSKAERLAAARNDLEWRAWLGITHADLRLAGYVHRELTPDAAAGDPYWTEWYCEPPATGQRYRVPPGEEERDGFEPVRRVYAIEVITDAAEEPPTPAG